MITIIINTAIQLSSICDKKHLKLFLFSLLHTSYPLSLPTTQYLHINIRSPPVFCFLLYPASSIPLFLSLLPYHVSSVIPLPSTYLLQSHYPTLSPHIPLSPILLSPTLLSPFLSYPILFYHPCALSI
jgi:hypothetical protein